MLTIELPSSPDQNDAELIEIGNKNAEENVAEENIEEEIVTELLNTSKQHLAEINISSETFHLVIQYVMEIVEKSSVKGKAQRALALKIIRSLVMDLVDEKTNKQEKILLIKLVDSGSVGNTIDLIIAASRGELNLNIVTETGRGCFSSFCPYILKKISQAMKAKQRQRGIK